MRRKKEKAALTPEQLEKAHQEFDDQFKQIHDLYQRARRDRNDTRAHDLADLLRSMRAQEREWFAENTLVSA